MRRTKLICTLGPATAEEKTMEAIIKEGCDIARFNVAHGSVESHVKLLETLREASQNCKSSVSTMLDIKGPELRVAETCRDSVSTGDEITLGDEGCIKLNHDVYSSFEPGTRILIHDGEIVMRIKNAGDLAVATVLQGGRLAGGMGVNAPDINLPVPYIQERDLNFMRAMKDVDFIAASFTRSASDISKLRAECKKIGMNASIIAKIENMQGVQNIEDILEVSDGIMVARGDLGTEIPVERLPEVQKYLLKKAREMGKPAIVATQILESMINAPFPTRAEVSDIANAILDGGDALMLSGETAVGRYPVEAVRTLARVAERADQMLCRERTFIDLKGTISESVSNAAVLLAEEVQADAILVLTKSGKTARLVSRHRPAMKILAATYNQSVLRKLSMYWGVQGFLIERFEHADRAVKNAIATAESMGLVKRGNTLVVVGGEPSGAAGTTNFVWAQIVGDIIARGTGFGTGLVSGRACRYPEICDVTVVDAMPEHVELPDARALIIESRIYDPKKIKCLVSKGMVALAGTGKIENIPESITVDPGRGVAWR